MTLFIIIFTIIFILVIIMNIASKSTNKIEEIPITPIIIEKPKRKYKKREKKVVINEVSTIKKTPIVKTKKNKL